MERSHRCPLGHQFNISIPNLHCRPLWSLLALPAKLVGRGLALSSVINSPRIQSSPMLCQALFVEVSSSITCREVISRMVVCLLELGAGVMSPTFFSCKTGILILQAPMILQWTCMQTETYQVGLHKLLSLIASLFVALVRRKTEMLYKCKRNSNMWVTLLKLGGEEYNVVLRSHGANKIQCDKHLFVMIYRHM